MKYKVAPESGTTKSYQAFNTKPFSHYINLKEWSGKPGSNRRPQPWQGCALPTELFPLTYIYTVFQKIIYLCELTTVTQRSQSDVKKQVDRVRIQKTIIQKLFCCQHK